MRGSLFVFLAAGLACSFQEVAVTMESGGLVESESSAGETSATVASTSGSTSGSSAGPTGPGGSMDTTGPELTTDDPQDAQAFFQELVVTNPDDYDFPEVPLLVTLTADNTLWDLIEPDLSNLRFVGSQNGADVELPFEVGGIGNERVQLWVLLPEVSTAADVFRVEYGLDVSHSVWAPDDVWAAYEAVWHLGEDPTDPEPQFLDSSGYERHITNPQEDPIPSDEMVRGIVGRAPRFAEDRELQISNSAWPQANVGDAFTVEAWVQYDEPPPGSYRSIVRKNGAFELVGSRNQAEPLNQPAWGVHDGSVFRYAQSDSSWSQGAGVWNYAAATFARDGDTGQIHMALYIDGIEAGIADFADFDPVQNAADFRIGSNLTAVVDEVRVSFEVRPSSWFDLQNRSMRDQLLEVGDPIPL